MYSPIIIVGAGVSGLFTAALLRQRYPTRAITIIEQSDTVGGMYASFNYGEAGYFDCGMHIFYDTGIEEIDTLLHGLLPEDEWHILEGNRKDIAGIFWNGKLQQYSPYIDLRTLPSHELKTCIDGLYKALKMKDTGHQDIAGYLEYRFGKPIASHLIDVVEKLYGTSATLVSRLALHQPTMDRVLLFDKEQMPDIMKTKTLKERIGYPDQLTLPARVDSQCGWYPKKFGILHVINALKQRLVTQGVEFIFNAKIENISPKQKFIHTIGISTSEGKKQISNVNTVYWTVGWPQLARLLGLSINKSSHTKAAHIHMCFPRLLDMGELYHFYCFDKGYKTFRVTNYANYCPAARNSLGYPISIEYWPEATEKNSDLLSNALRELYSFGVLDKTEVPSFAATQLLPNYHRLFSLDNITDIKMIREHIQSMNIKNLINIGVMASSRELLFYEIMRDAHAKLQ